jgi:two-component system, LytTR family, response regulator
MAIRVVVVDDESFARARVRMFTRTHGDVEIVAEAGDHEEALAAIGTHTPDAIFVDVELPGVSGLELVRRIDPDRRPHVVFVTAFAQYAVEAFDVGAVHYLVKPFGPEEVTAALRRIREAMSSRAATAAFSQLGGGSAEGQRPLQRVVVKHRGRARLLRVEQIDWIEAAGNYTRIHVSGASHLLRESIVSLEKKLDRQQFVRVHRSAMVNLDRIRELLPMSHGDYVLILHDDTRIALSRGYRSRLEVLLGRL